MCCEHSEFTLELPHSLTFGDPRGVQENPGSEFVILLMSRKGERPRFPVSRFPNPERERPIVFGSENRLSGQPVVEPLIAPEVQLDSHATLVVSTSESLAPVAPVDLSALGQSVHCDSVSDSVSVTQPPVGVLLGDPCSLVVSASSATPVTSSTAVPEFAVTQCPTITPVLSDPHSIGESVQLQPSNMATDRKMVMDFAYKGLGHVPIEDYLAVFETKGIAEGQRSKELANCLSYDVTRQLLAHGYDFNAAEHGYVTLKAALLARFKGGKVSTIQAVDKLRHAVQKPDQSPREFAGVIATLAIEAKVTDGSVQVDYFLAGIKEKVLLALGDKTFDSLTAASEAAQLVEDRLATAAAARGEEKPSPVAALSAPQIGTKKQGEARGRAPAHGGNGKQRKQRGRSKSRGGGQNARSFQGECYNCNKKGHKAADCRSKPAGFGAVGSRAEPIHFPAVCNGRGVHLMADTGAGRSFVRRSVIAGWGLNLVPTDFSPISADSSPIEILGRVTVNLTVAGVTRKVKFFVIEDLLAPFVAGIDLLKAFKLLVDPSNDRILRESGGTLVPIPGVPSGGVTPTSSAVSDDLLVTDAGAPRESKEGSREGASESSKVSNVKAGLPSPAVPVSVQPFIVRVELTPAQYTGFSKMRDQYPLLFSSKVNVIRLANVKPMSIRVKPGTRPFRAHFSNSWSFEDAAAMRIIIADWFKQKVIRVSRSPWNAFPLVVWQGKPRLCINFRGVNLVTEVDDYPLPLTDDIRRLVQGAMVFSTVDLKTGFILVPIEEESRCYTAFTDCDGNHYEFNRVAFGLKGSPPHFQECMDTVLAGVANCFCYIDDLLLWSKTVEEHMTLLSTVFKRLDDARLLINSEKCHFFMSSVRYLGHIISVNGLAPDPEKVEAIRTLGAPRDVSELRRFFGISGWFGLFVRDFGKAKAPLLPLLKKNVPFIWVHTHQAAFDDLKERICHAVQLFNPDMKKPFILETDASRVGLGAVLLQKDDKGVERPVQFLSRALHGPEVRYAAQELECLAIIWAVDRLKFYLVGNPNVTIRTDHQSLKWMLDSKQSNVKILKWAARFRALQAKIEYRPGVLNGPADFLSRHQPPAMPDAEGGEMLATAVSVSQEWTDADVLRSLQVKDAFCAKVLAMNGKERDGLAHQFKIASLHVGSSGVLLADVPHRANPRTVIVAPAAIIPQILEAMHDWPQGGHLGRDKTVARVKAQFFWVGLFQDVTLYVQNCEKCSARRPGPPQQVPMGELRAHEPNELVACDFMGPFPETPRGNQHILLIIDHFSRFVVAVPTADQTAATVVRVLLDSWFSLFGPPQRLLTDRAQNFSSELLKEVLHLLRVRKVFTTAYHPQGDGMAERANGTIQSILSKVVNQDVVDWDLHVSSAFYAMNTSVHTATREMPFRVMVGREPPRLVELPSASAPRSPSEFVAQAKLISKAVTDEVNKSLDMKSAALGERNAGVSFPYKIGDLVLVHNEVVPPGHSRKFHLPYQKQMVVKAIFPPATVEVVEPNATNDKVGRRVNLDRLKLAPMALQSSRYALDVTQPRVVAAPNVGEAQPTTAKEEAPRRSGRERRLPVRFDE